MNFKAVAMGRTLILTGAAALSCVGCGSSSNDGGSRPAETESRPPERTRAAYIAEADGFCKEFNAESKRLNTRIKKLVKAAPDDSSALDAIAPILSGGLQAQRKKQREFQQIEPPKADRDVIQTYWDAGNDQTALLGRLADAAADQDVERFGSLGKEQQTVAERARGLAQGYGFKECGSGSSEAD